MAISCYHFTCYSCEGETISSRRLSALETIAKVLRDDLYELEDEDCPGCFRDWNKHDGTLNPHDPGCPVKKIQECLKDLEETKDF